MSTGEGERVATRVRVDDRRGGPAGGWHTNETKPSFKTTELAVLVAAAIGVLIAAAVDDSIDARLAWILVTALACAYMLSRGIAKAGSRYADGWNDRP